MTAADATPRYEGIDHIILAAAQLDAAAAPFARLGLQLASGMAQSGLGTHSRGFAAGGSSNLFYVELLGVADAAEAQAHNPLAPLLGPALERGGALLTVGLRVTELQPALDALRACGVGASVVPVFDSGGARSGDFALLDFQAPMIVHLALVEYARSQAERSASMDAAGLLRHDFPLKRLDHLAAIAPDLETACRFWTETLGIPLFGEVVSPTTVIRQFKVGDAIIELLGPASADSPLRGRPAGLISMAAFEVAEAPAAVAQARAAGFTAPDPAPGALPGTRTATIPATELSGLALQLLEYI